jgi:hypothetical protein
MKGGQLQRLEEMAKKEYETTEIKEEKPVVKKPAAQKPAERKKTAATKTTETKEKETGGFEGSRLFDIEADGVIYPERSKRNGKIECKFASTYLPIEEYEYVEKNARKHRMTVSAYIRTLLINGD